jgi:hypothetical protein
MGSDKLSDSRKEERISSNWYDECVKNQPITLVCLGGVFLSVTGLEALYADLGMERKNDAQENLVVS